MNLKSKDMQRLTLGMLIAFLISLAGCQSDPSKSKDIEALQQDLKESRKEYEKLRSKITKLERKILEKDSSAIQLQKKTQVDVMPLKNRKFQHFIELQGNVSSKENINVSSDLGGTVTKIYVEGGQEVQKGDMLVKLDAQTIRSNIDELETNLDLAREVYKRQKNLWEQNIGSEIQYLQAKNEKEALEKKLNTARTKLAKTKIKAPINGTIDEVIIKIGEMASPGRPLMRLVNLSTVQVQADASEKYIGKIHKGDSVKIDFPSIDKTRAETVSSVGQVINPINRTFKVEVTLDNPNKLLKPNLLGTIRIADYQKESAIVISSKYIQHSEEEEYVFILSKSENGQSTAQKVSIQRGKTYNGNTEILKGLNQGDHLITAGFRDVIDGEPVSVQKEVDKPGQLALDK